MNMQTFITYCLYLIKKSINSHTDFQYLGNQKSLNRIAEVALGMYIYTWEGEFNISISVRLQFQIS